MLRRPWVTKRFTPEEIKERWERRIRPMAKLKWEQAGCPEGRDKEFWLAAEDEAVQKDRAYAAPLAEPALPVYIEDIGDAYPRIGC